MELSRARGGEASLLTALVLASKASNGYDAAFMEACRYCYGSRGKPIKAAEQYQYGVPEEK